MSNSSHGTGNMVDRAGGALLMLLCRGASWFTDCRPMNGATRSPILALWPKESDPCQRKTDHDRWNRDNAHVFLSGDEIAKSCSQCY